MPPDPPRWSRAFGVRFAPPKKEGLATPLNDDETEFVLIGSRQQLAKVKIDAIHVDDCVTPYLAQ
jgi:hypothetical protein